MIAQAAQVNITKPCTSALGATAPRGIAASVRV